MKVNQLAMDKRERRARDCAATYLWNAWTTWEVGRDRRKAYDYAVAHLDETAELDPRYGPGRDILEDAAFILENSTKVV